jgi:hypothetical protein
MEYTCILQLDVKQSSVSVARVVGIARIIGGYVRYFESYGG